MVYLPIEKAYSNNFIEERLQKYSKSPQRIGNRIPTLFGGIKNENPEVARAPQATPCNVSGCEDLVLIFYMVEFDSEYGPIGASLNGCRLHGQIVKEAAQKPPDWVESHPHTLHGPLFLASLSLVNPGTRTLLLFPKIPWKNHMAQETEVPSLPLYPGERERIA